MRVKIAHQRCRLIIYNKLDMTASHILSTIPSCLHPWIINNDWQARKNKLFEDNFRRSFCEQPEACAVWRMSYDGRHRLANWVECVHFVQLVLGTRGTDGFIVMAEVKHKAKQSTLRLVADLFWHLALHLGWLYTKKPNWHRRDHKAFHLWWLYVVTNFGQR